MVDLTDRHGDSPLNNPSMSPLAVDLLKTSNFQVGDESYLRKQFFAAISHLPLQTLPVKHVQ